MRWLLQQFHLERLQEKLAHFFFNDWWQNLQLTHGQIGIIELFLLPLLLLILCRKLINENTNQIRIDHGIDDVDAEHHGHLARSSSINLDQSERNGRVVPSCKPLVEHSVIFGQLNPLTVSIQSVV